MVDHLNKLNRSWEHFLFWRVFNESVVAKPKSKKKETQSKKIKTQIERNIVVEEPESAM
jgi:hypothetical protein